MGFSERVSQGVQAGVLAGVAVAVFFFVADLVQLAPLSTPSALQRTFIGPGGMLMEFPIETQVLAAVSYGASFVTFTIVHLLAFAALGVGAALVLCGRPFGACAFTGACYGGLVCSVAFYGSLALTGAHMVAEMPGLLPVIGANLCAGAVMGAYLGLAGDEARHTPGRQALVGRGGRETAEA